MEVRRRRWIVSAAFASLLALLAFAPCAYASTADTITLPNGEERAIPYVEVADQAVSLASVETDDSDIVYINSIDEFDDIADEDWYQYGKTFVVTCDLDLTKSEKYSDTYEWEGFIQYFYGTLKGSLNNTGAPVKIYGLPDNTSFIYGIIGGTIENIEFVHSAGSTTEGGSASFITFMPARSNVTEMLVMKNVIVSGSIALTGSDQSNYAPFVYCASLGGLYMEDCTNSAAITGTIYGSVFHGYTATVVGTEDSPISYTFKNCLNTGNITYQYAGMFFGNPTRLESNLEQGTIKLTITGCSNTGTIRGTTGADYLAAPVGTQYGAAMNEIESVLDGTAGASTSYATAEEVELGDAGKLCVGSELEGLAIARDNDDTTELVVTLPTSSTDKTKVDHYVINIGVYTYLWDIENEEFDGTNRVNVSETVTASGLTDATFTPELKALDFADSKYGFSGEQVAGYATRQGTNGTLFYKVENEYDGTYKQYCSNTVVDDEPVSNATKAAQLITVSAYDASGNLLDVASVG